MTGLIEQVVDLQPPGLRIHHDIFRTEHGTWLSLGSELVQVENYPTSTTDASAPTATVMVEDEGPVEFLDDGTVLHNWRLTDILDPTRIGYKSLENTRQGGEDWAHTNAVIHDPRDDSLIVSVRHQNAVVKIDRTTGALKWILGDHANWKPVFQPFLLTPVGEPFEWQYAQHAMTITPSGTLGLFDNGNERASPFDGQVPLEPLVNYSRAVEYDINEETMEVRQVWQYGMGADVILYAGSLSDADWLSTADNVLITFGNVGVTDGMSNEEIGRGARGYGRVVEVARTPIERDDLDQDVPVAPFPVQEKTSERVFDLSIYRTGEDRRTIYRSEKIPSLYPDGVIVTHHPVTPVE